VAAGRAEPGFFDPDSVAWRVHGDFTIMLVGGVSALLLQMLHPAALAGVWDHSDFRRDMAGRLGRTASFLSGTTFGSTEEARALIARVRAVHGRIKGVLPHGRPYSANDPDLLTWVHVAGTWSFLQSYLRYGPGLRAADRDRYFAETARVALELGAADVPTSYAAAAAYLDAMRPRLSADERTRKVAAVVLSEPAPSLRLEPVRALLLAGAIQLLPPWAAQMHRLRQGRHGTAADAGLRGLCSLVAWALTPGSPSRFATR
jgi:uncharacterized protein (DUF2236 family)